MEPLFRSVLAQPASRCLKLAKSSHALANYHLQLQVSQNRRFPQYVSAPALASASASASRRYFLVSNTQAAPSSIAACGLGLSSCRGIWGPSQTIPLRRAPHLISTSTATRGHSTATHVAEAPHDSITTTTTAAADRNMADRNILPDHIKVDHYDIVLTNLDFANWRYNGSVTYAETQTTPRLSESLI